MYFSQARELSFLTLDLIGPHRPGAPSYTYQWNGYDTVEILSTLTIPGGDTVRGAITQVIRDVGV